VGPSGQQGGTYLVRRSNGKSARFSARSSEKEPQSAVPESGSLGRIGRDGASPGVAGGRRPLMALAVVCGAAVLREGSEVVLFLYGIILSGTSGPSLLLGGLLGLACGVAVSALSYVGLLAIPQRYIFRATSWLITLIAAGLAAQAVAFLNAAGVLTTFSSAAWDTSGILSDQSLFGILLHTLIGYVDRPTGMQLLAYVATIVGMWGLMRYAAPGRRPATT
jgi:high-affinity iron transporter